MTQAKTKPTLPRVIGRENMDGARVLHLDMPSDLAWFDGHFPGDPILPAVVQIDWAIHFGAESGLDRHRFAGMSRLKFGAVIAPTTRLRLTLTATDDTLGFRYESPDGLHSKGKIRFHGSDDQR